MPEIDQKQIILNKTMLRKLLFASALVFSVALVAQNEQKIAYVNTQEVIRVMPEVSEMEKAVATMNENYKNELTKMQEEYNKKYSDFIAEQDSLTENIKVRRMQEVQELQQRIQNFYQIAEQDLDKKQRELFAPIQQKLTDAIKSVGAENNYTYVLDAAVFLYMGPNAVDATALVKQKLGIK